MSSPIPIKAPVAQPCHHCDQPYAGIICPTCKEERPAYALLKKLSVPRCRYYTSDPCDCGGLGHCLVAA